MNWQRAGLAIMLAAVPLASCGSGAVSNGQSQPQAGGPQRAVLEARTVGDPTRPEIVGLTNLPEGTVLMVSLSRQQIGFAAGDRTTVSEGRFQHPAITLDGGPLPPGTYSLSVSTPNADLQPPSVREAVGKDYSNFTGPLVVDPYGYGPSVTFEGTHKVPGRMSPAEVGKEQQRRYAELEEWARRSCAEIRTPSIREKCLTDTLAGVRETMGLD